MTQRAVHIEGGGIAGQVLRRELQRRGVAVRIFDKAKFPRDKVCGGILQPESWRYLRSAFGDIGEGLPVGSISHFRGKRLLATIGLAEPLIYIPRLVLDDRLNTAQIAESASAPSPAWTTVKATGAPADGDWIGFQASGEPVRTLEMRYGRGLYAGVSPAGDGESHVALLIRRERFRNPADVKAEVHSELGIRLISALKGTTRIRYGYSGEKYAVGDAMLTTHPFLGLGMKHAILSACLFAELFAKGREADYAVRHRRIFRRFHTASRMAAALYGSGWQGLLWSALERRVLFEMLYRWTHRPPFELPDGAGRRPVFEKA